MCESDANCVDGDIIKVCYENNAFAEESNFCDCSNWFGWVGSDCNEVSSTLIYSRILNVCFIVAAVILIVLSLFVLKRHLLQNTNKPHKKTLLL